MKKLLVILFAISVLPAFAQEKSESKMKQYFLVVLIKGENRTQDSLTAVKIQQEHIANMEVMHKAGKLDIAGPFGDDTDWRGIFILNVPTLKEAEELLQTDAAIRSGRLSYIIHPWWSEKGSMLR